nr:hypothetical protein CFP56_11624 [Quercus suber]
MLLHTGRWLSRLASAGASRWVGWSLGIRERCLVFNASRRGRRRLGFRGGGGYTAWSGTDDSSQLANQSPGCAAWSRVIRGGGLDATRSCQAEGCSGRRCLGSRSRSDGAPKDTSPRPVALLALRRAFAGFANPTWRHQPRLRPLPRSRPMTIRCRQGDGPCANPAASQPAAGNGRRRQGLAPPARAVARMHNGRQLYSIRIHLQTRPRKRASKCGLHYLLSRVVSSWPFACCTGTLPPKSPRILSRKNPRLDLASPQLRSPPTGEEHNVAPRMERQSLRRRARTLRFSPPPEHRCARRKRIVSEMFVVKGRGRGKGAPDQPPSWR